MGRAIKRSGVTCKVEENLKKFQKNFSVLSTSLSLSENRFFYKVPRSIIVIVKFFEVKMKITVNQLRRIIKEEVSKVLKEAPMEVDAKLEIPDVSSQADYMEMSPEDWSHMVEMMAKKYPNVEVEGYSDEYDSFLVYGPSQELTALAKALDMEMMGGAQSIGAEDSFVGFIEEI